MKRILDENLRGCEKILDAGGGRKLEERSEWWKQGFGDKEEFISVDVEANRNPDVVADLCDLPFEDGRFDGVICLEVFEHVYNPFKAVSEIHRILEDSGVVVFSSPFMYPYHYDEKPDRVDGERSTDKVRDYWRISRDGWENLLEDFDYVEIWSDTDWVDTAFYFGTFSLVKSGSLKPVKNLVRVLLKPFQNSGSMIEGSGMRYWVIARK